MSFSLLAFLVFLVFLAVLVFLVSLGVPAPCGRRRAFRTNFGLRPRKCAAIPNAAVRQPDNRGFESLFSGHPPTALKIMGIVNTDKG